MTDLEKQQIFELIKQAKEGKQSALRKFIIVLVRLFIIQFIIL